MTKKTQKKQKTRKAKLSPEEEKRLLEAEIKENVKATFNLGDDEVDTTEDGGINDKYYDNYDTKKLILIETLDVKNKLSLTQLNDDEIEDLENARMLNCIFNNPLIEQVCDDHMALKRSLTSEFKSLLNHLFDWSSSSFGDIVSSNPITRVLGKKGAK
jgi:hypothetical protein